MYGAIKRIPLIERNINSWRSAFDCDFVVVAGYKSQCLKVLTGPGSQHRICVLEYGLELVALHQIERMEQEYVYISYGDIVLSQKNIEALMQYDADINVIVDRQWEDLWICVWRTT